MIKAIIACFVIALELTNGLALRGDLPQRRLEVAEYMEAMAGPPPPFCFIENGFDYVSEDIKNLPGPTAESCCSKCLPAEGCNAYSWTNFNGGTCWLKRSRGKIIVNANVKSALFFFNPRETCEIKNDVDFIGNDIGNAASATAEACCGLCRNFPGCRAYSWSNHNGGTCWFKSSRGQAQTKTGVKSADVFPTLDSNPVCAQEFNLDFVGFDIGNAPSPLAAGCCSICAATPPCRAFSWSNFNGGTCWLKSYKGEAVAKQGVVSAQIIENPPAFCDFEEGTDYVGNDIGSVPSKNPSLCCPLCRDREGCKAVTWSDYNGGTCWLKSAKGDTAATAGVKSATLPGMAL